jgi:hypothetical protein
MARPVLTLPPKINLTGGPFGTGDTIYAMCVKINTWIDQLESVLEYVDSVNADMEDIETAIETINQSITLAQKWASEAVDVIVSDGEYSAKHYATKAQEHAADLASALSQVSASLTTIQGIGSDVDTALTTIQGIQTSVNTALSQAQAAAAQADASAGSAAASEAVAVTKASEAATSATTAQTAATQAAGYASDAEDSAAAAASSALTAGGSATSASGSAALAATARDEAQTARNQAVSAASDAADSEANAAVSAGAASVSAGNASTSASQASTSASTATTKATEASTHADAAAVSASDASDSADAAALSATQAGTHAGNAASSATAASVSETNAAASEAAAAASASDASDSADAAAVSATQAGTHAGNAASSASAAAVSAGQAADSAQQALDAVGSLNFPTIQSGDALKLLQVNATEDGYQFATVVLPTDSDDVPEGSVNLYMTTAERSKLSGIAAGATANQTDAHLLDRANHTGTQAIATVSGLQAALDSMAASSHGHAIGDVTGLQDALDSKAAASHTHLWAHITDKPATFTPSAHDHDDLYYTKAQVDTSLSGKAAASHSHTIGDVTGLQDALDGKAASGHDHTWAQITDKPSTFAPSTHTHLWADITDKPSTFTPSTHNHDERYYTETEVDTLLSGKSDTGHSHSWAEITSKPSTFTPSAHSHAIGDVTGLQAALDGKAAASHSHDASQITTGTVAAARLGSGSSITTKFLRGDNTWQDVPAGGDYTQAAIHGAAAKTTPADDDTTALIDSAASNALKKLSWANIKATLKTYFDTLYATGSHTHAWSAITDKPTTFSPSAHTHDVSDITATGTPGTTTYLRGDGSWQTPETGASDWSEITGKPSTFPPDTHNHDDRYYTESESDALLTGKADASHTHIWADITDKPTTFSPSAHNHSASEITDFDAEVANNSSVAANTAKVSYTDAAKVATIETNADVTDSENVGSSIHGSAAKTTLADADTIPLIDSAASNVLKKITWANIKVVLGNTFVNLTGNESISGTKTFSTIPVLPASDPTSDNQAARKAYVDSSKYQSAINTQTNNYQLVLADAGKTVIMNSASARTVTIPANGTVNYPVGTIINIMRQGTGSVQIVVSSVTGYSANGYYLNKQYSGCSLQKIGTNTWCVFGDMKESA